MQKSSWLGLGLAALGIGTLLMLDQLDPRRKAVVDAALSKLGATNGNEFWADTLPGVPPSDYPKDYCGGFALWAIHQAGLGLNLDWKIGSGFLIPNLSQTKNPKPGDIAYFAHNEHHAVVRDVSNGSVGLINGNGAGGQVTQSIAPMSTVTAFFSLEKLLETNPGTKVGGSDVVCPDA